MKRLINILALIALCSCTQPTPPPQTTPKTFFNFFQDDATKLCFAVYKYSNSFSFTHVPCTVEVMRLITGSK